MVKYLVIGKDGQLGREFIKRFTRDKAQFFAMGHDDMDICNYEMVMAAIENLSPEIMINCAAYNLVDQAEERYDLAIGVNAIGVKNLAAAATKYNAFLVHYSTDYVFDGRKEGALYTEEDEVNPLSQYARSKRLGEIFMEQETGMQNSLLFRVSWVYGEGKQNFISKLLQWVNSNEYLRIAYDEFSVPTNSGVIVDTTIKALDQRLTGMFNLVNSGYASRYEWAKAVLKNLRVRKFIYPVPSAAFDLAAERPVFSAMSNEKLSTELGIELPQWEDSLRDYLNPS